jgi:acetolactate synthase-1/2/3 large subunit
VVFGLPGVHNLPAWNALAASRIRVVAVRHEQTAVYAADGYARASGRVGVALVTTGPGAANTLGATGEAWASHSLVLVIATDIPTTLRRPGVVGGALHECADQAAMFAPVTEARRRVEAPDAIPGALAELLRGIRRPAYLEVPADVLTAAASLDSAAGRANAVPPAEPDPTILDHAAEILARAERPLVWAGGGARDADEQVRALAERLQAPVLTTYSGRGLLGDHPLAVGLPPHVPEVGALWDAADVVVAIGSDLDGMSTQNWRMPPPPHLIAINIDAHDAAKNYSGLVIEADAAVSAALAERVEERAPWADLDGVRREAWAGLRRDHPAEVAFLDAFAAAAPDEAVVLADMCVPGYWIAGFHRFTAPRRLQYPMGWGTLGYAFPASIGAAIAARGPVVSISGDGGFLFACGELATVAQEGLPVTTVIVDDGGYGMLRYDQRNRDQATAYGVDLKAPDFVALAQAFGLRAERVDGLGESFRRALAAQIATDAPTVLVTHAALAPPPTTSPRWYRAGPPHFAR